jgi:hypothetical protein
MTTERWALVPVEATILQRLEMAKADDESGDRYRKMSAAMIQASPGAALLAEVLAARDAYLSAVRDGGTSSESRKNRTDTHYALFAALDKISPWHHEEADKLGPAAEGAT